MFRIGRREFVCSLGVLTGATAWPRVGRAQEPGRIYRLGDLHLSPRDAPWNAALFSAVKADGFIDGQNLLVDEQGFGLHVAQLSEHASAVVKAKVEVIICGGDPPLRAAQQATNEIPILGIAEDMVGSRFVASLAQPGGNTTGVSILSSELDSKRQEILMEAMPGARRYAALADVNSGSPQQLKMLEETTRARGAELSIYRVAKSEDFAGAIDAAKKSGAEAFNVLASALLFNNRQIILARTAALGLPAMYQWPTVPTEGALIGYGPRLERIYGDIFSRQLVKLLRGIKPADIPVEQPDKFELAVNLKTAKALGLTIPNSLLARADEVIE
jgi:putative tryptophan/tyrosine transport system substrate-binding protein